MDAACAVTASYGRMAFYYILKALDLPAGSEIVVPALTFWVIPALAKVAGLKVVFADIDPETFTLSCGARARDHARHTRCRANAPVRPAVRHGGHSRHRGAP